MVNLLAELQQRVGVALVFIAHELAVVRHVSHRVAVMYLGRIAELGSAADVFTEPAHPCTRAFLSAAPIRHPRDRGGDRPVLQVDPPSPVDLPEGCRFHTRCPIAIDTCSAKVPALDPVADGHRAACHLAPAFA